MGKDLRTIAQLARGSLFTESQIRTWVRDADRNGLAAFGAIERAGSRILVETDKFYSWRQVVDRRRLSTPLGNDLGGEE